jgi:hypothetical protein
MGKALPRPLGLPRPRAKAHPGERTAAGGRGLSGYPATGEKYLSPLLLAGQGDHALWPSAIDLGLGAGAVDDSGELAVHVLVAGVNSVPADDGRSRQNQPSTQA